MLPAVAMKTVNISSSKTNSSGLTTGQKSIRCVQVGEIHLFGITHLSFLARLRETLKHRLRPASKHMLDLEYLRA